MSLIDTNAATTQALPFDAATTLKDLRGNTAAINAIPFRYSVRAPRVSPCTGGAPRGNALKIHVKLVSVISVVDPMSP